MNSEPTAPVRPDVESDYGQVLVRHLLSKYRWTLIGGLILGGVTALFLSLFSPPSYNASATIVVDKGGAGMGALSGGLALLGGGNSALDNEIEVIESREIASTVIDELGLQVEVVDWRSPDMTHNRILSKIGLGPEFKADRNQIFERLRITDVSVSPNMLENKVLILRTTATGWKVRSKSGAFGEPVEFDAFSFTPVFGSAHRAGDSYRLNVMTDWDAVNDFQSKLSASQLNDATNVVKIGFHHRNPFLCKQVVTAVTDTYLARYEQKEIGDYDVMLAYISDEIAEIESKITGTVAELDQYREENKLYQPTAQAAAAIQSMSELSINKGRNEIQLSQINSLLQGLTTRSAEEIYQSIQSPVNPLPIDQALTERLSSQITSLNGLRQTQTEAHPEVLRLKSSIDVTIGQIRDTLESSAAQLQLANREMNGDISGFRNQLMQLPAAESKIALLNSELQANGEILAMLRRSEAETRLIREGTTTEVSLLDSPMVPIKPSSPRLGKNAMLGGIGGIVIVILLVLMLESGSQFISSLREIRSGSGLQILGVLRGPIRKKPWGPDQFIDKQSISRIRSSIGMEGRLIGLVHVCGARGGFSLAWGLAASSAASQPTLLVDADTSAKFLCTALGTTVTKGLSDLNSNSSSDDDLLTGFEDQHWLLGPGSGQLNPESAIDFLKTLLDRFDSILVCLPNSPASQNTAALVSLLDDVVLVLPQTGCSRQELQAALGALQQAGIEPLGAVVTDYSPTRDTQGTMELRLSGLE